MLTGIVSGKNAVMLCCLLTSVSGLAAAQDEIERTQETVYIGSRRGDTATVISKRRIDTSNAEAVISLTEADAIASCVGYAMPDFAERGLDQLQTCMRRVLRERGRAQVQIIADCRARTLRDYYGDSWVRRVDRGSEQPGWQPSGRRAGADVHIPGSTLDSQFRLLCPRTTTEDAQLARSDDDDSSSRGPVRQRSTSMGVFSGPSGRENRQIPPPMANAPPLATQPSPSAVQEASPSAAPETSRMAPSQDRPSGAAHERRVLPAPAFLWCKTGQPIPSTADP